jgi:RNA polymerase sigma factor (TIGR02999 family)
VRHLPVFSLSIEPDVSQLIATMRTGDRAALDRIFDIVYDELRGRARAQLGRWRPGDTLDTTALVHETYVRFAGDGRPRIAPEDRAHFFAIAARAMRQIIIDHARQAGAVKRGGNLAIDTLWTDDGVQVSDPEPLLALDEALERLAQLDARLARIVDLRFFAGLSVEETAEVLDVSTRTIKRDWRKARALLYDALNDSRPDDPAAHGRAADGSAAADRPV